MKVMDAIRDRRSIRDYENMPVPEDKLGRIMEAARLSPSARNSQDREFVVVRGAEQRQKLARAASHQAHVAQAPVLIAAIATKPDYQMPNGVLAYPMDLGIALDHITLVAVEEGLGTCWIGGFSQEAAREALNVPDNYVIGAIVTLGFPKTVPVATPRRSGEEVFHSESFVSQV